MPGFSRPIDVEPIREAVERTQPRTQLAELEYASAYRIFEDI